MAYNKAPTKEELRKWGIPATVEALALLSEYI